MIFKWDENKNLSNIRKHGINFNTASYVFNDPDALFSQDRIENGEERWQAIGMIDGIMMVLVAHTYIDDGESEVIRIISARKANQKEKKNYVSKTYK